MTHFQMYLITRLDVLVGLSLVGLIIAIVGMVVAGVFWTVEDDKEKLLFLKLFKQSALLALVFGFLLTGVPSTKDIALIYAVPAIINNEDVQATPPELMKLARIKIEEMLKEEKK